MLLILKSTLLQINDRNVLNTGTFPSLELCIPLPTVSYWCSARKMKIRNGFEQLLLILN